MNYFLPEQECTSFLGGEGEIGYLSLDEQDTIIEGTDLDYEYHQNNGIGNSRGEETCAKLTIRDWPGSLKTITPLLSPLPQGRPETAVATFLNAYLTG